MKSINTLILLLFCLFAAGRLAAEEKIVPEVYCFGFSASFNDSTVYFTDIQKLENVWLDTKTGFILERGVYANQMRNYFNGINQPDRTCVFFYAVTFKDLGKKFRKMKKKYVTGNKFDIKYLKPAEFSFEPAFVYDIEEIKAQREQAEKEMKKKKNAGGKMGPPNGGGGGPGGGGPGGGMGGGGGMPPGGGF